MPDGHDFASKVLYRTNIRQAVTSSKRAIIQKQNWL